MIFNDVCPGARRRRSRGASSSSLSDAKVIISWLNRLLQIAEGRGRQAATWCGPLWSLKIWAEFPLKSPAAEPQRALIEDKREALRSPPAHARPLWGGRRWWSFRHTTPNFNNHSFWIDMIWRYEWIVSSVKKIIFFLFLPLSASFQCEPQYAHIAQSTILKGCWSWSIDTRQATLWLHHWNPLLVSVDWLTSWSVSGMADAASCYRDQLLAPKNPDLRVWVFGLLSVQRNLLDGSLSTECWVVVF